MGIASRIAVITLGLPLLAVEGAPAETGYYRDPDDSLRFWIKQVKGKAIGPATVKVGSGEETGKLDELMLRTSQSLEGEVEHAIEMALVLLEPLLVGLLAVIVGFIVISVFLPLYSFLQGVG